MSDSFENKVRAAAIAGWWTLLIGVLLFILQWVAYLLLTSARPAWLLWFWGDGTSWDIVQSVWFWGAAALKVCLWLMALIVIWLTLWARQLRKNSR